MPVRRRQKSPSPFNEEHRTEGIVAVFATLSSGKKSVNYNEQLREDREASSPWSSDWPRRPQADEHLDSYPPAGSAKPWPMSV
ncbi:hypothetical protein A5707_03940 [Mycobacterium kyorinense]|uniref:Uncharacterized protein n=1 Tax=Mycobacterium kyorinense TaxID=487514 RepID=A0A1A2Z079_9MYCO|nr:hypothetical protein A5707_03940 [Mycobacterium kyorinense]